MLDTVKSFFSPTVDSILADFTSVVKRLETLGSFHDAKIKAYEEALAFSEKESAKAKAVAEKIKGLLA